MRKVQKGFGFKSEIVDESEAKDIKAITTIAIECLICENIFYGKDIGPQKGAAMSCQCKNIFVSLAKFYAPRPYKSEYYMKLACDRKNTKIYEVMKDTLKRIEPHKDY
jgi:hypothetical protein